MPNYDENDPVLGLFQPKRTDHVVYCCGVIPMVSIVGLVIAHFTQVLPF